MSAQAPSVPFASGTRLASSLFVVLLVAGASLRLVSLDRRPLHGDEAVGGSLAADVARTGSFLYESSNRHGPFQYFLGGFVMQRGGESDFWIRFPYALAGCLLPLALYGFRRALGDSGWLMVCSFTVFSPFFVYYSRYAIQEIYLIVATALLFSCGLAFAREGRGIWLIGTLVAAAWMVTLKETFVVVWGCLAAAAAAGAVLGGRRFRDALAAFFRKAWDRRFWMFSGAMAGALMVTAAYTDLFRNASGLRHLAANVIDMLGFGASTAHAVELHRHPIAFYLTLLARFEWLVTILGVAGVVVALRVRRPRELFLALYALLSLAVHFALPYKTPWLLMTPLLPLTILAGVLGARVPLRRGSAATPVFTLVVACVVPLALLPRTLESSFTRPADPVLGLAYHHAGVEQIELARQIHDVIARVADDTTPKAMIALPYSWPLAWYLRDESDIEYERSAVPRDSPEHLAGIPVVVTLEGADRKFLLAFTGSESVPSFSLPDHVSRRVVLIPPDYMVGRVWIRGDLTRTAPPRD